MLNTGKSQATKKERLEAHRVIAEHNQIKLNLQDSQAFVESLLNPPAPNDLMIKAAAEYKKAMGLE